MILDILKSIVTLGAGRGRLERELAPLRKFINVEELIPWSKEELNLLSLQLEHKTKKSFFNTVVSGSFKTIYAEPIISYAYKDVYTGTKRGLILAKSNKHEYVYRLSQGVAQVYIDGRQVGVIDYQGRLITSRSRVLGQIEQSSGNIQEIMVGGKKIGSLNKPKADAALHERAIQIFKETKPSDKQIVISLALFEILKRNV